MTKKRCITGIDEVGRAALKRASLARHSFVIGLDEVGRGSLAGPVVVAAIVLPLRLKLNNFVQYFRNRENIGQSGDKSSRQKSKGFRNKIHLKDSKQLTPKQRGIWFEYIKNNPQISYALASVSPKIVDRINISQAANLAASRAFIKLTKNWGVKIKKYKIFLDGGLYLSKIPNSRFPACAGASAGRQILNSKTIVKGDEKINAIKLASIAAKVSRDRLMTKLHKKYPRYGFAQHKGYGTKKHIRTIKKFGPTKIHRLTFLKKILKSQYKLKR